MYQLASRRRRREKKTCILHMKIKMPNFSNIIFEDHRHS